MNIGLITREYPPFFGGGIGTYARQFARALAGCGHRPVVITVSDDGRERRQDERGVTVVRLPFLKGSDWSGPHPAIATPEATAAFRTFHPVSVLAMELAKALPRLIDEFELEAVEAPDTGALAWFVLNERRIGGTWPRGVPLAVVVHSPSRWVADLNGERTGPASEHLMAMEAECAGWCDGLVTPSAGMAGWAEATPCWDAARGSVAVVPYALGDLEPRARESATGTPARDGSRLLFVGRLEPRKGLETLIPAFGRLVDTGADLHLDLCGQDMVDPRTGKRLGGSLIGALGPAAQERVSRLGRIAPERVAHLRGGTRIAVVPSPNDNYPFSCIEAMCEGQVVVAADAGGMREMIRHGVDGLLFAPGDVGACTEALRTAHRMSEAEAACMGRSAAWRILNLCGNERVVEERLRHYRAAASAVRPVASPRPGVMVVDARYKDPLPTLLLGAIRDGIGFAHGWTRDDHGRVTAFATPRGGTVRNGRAIGPLAVEASLAAALGPAGRDGVVRVADTRQLAAELLAAGARGTVVPAVVSRVPGPSAGARLWRRLMRR
ncbi:MAG: glycosyltransferase family 4 protein [Phycisphaerales bacterium]|nr:glycosyltransferase family 4 protein [Phycisphaerales bacterium]